MSWFDLHLVEGVPRPMVENSVEAKLAEASDAFAAAWASVRGLLPTATLQWLFVGDDGLSREGIEDLADAARMAGAEPPDLLRWFALECPDDLADGLLPMLEALPLFDWVGERPVTVPASARDGVVSWGTNPLAVGDPVLRGTPDGVGAIHGWRVPGGTGLDVNIAHVESGWWLAHEDLLTARVVKHSVFGTPSAADLSHGTSVAGIVVGADNGVGMVGIAPDAQMILVTQERENHTFSLPKAITVAATAAGPGGVLLLALGQPYRNKNGPDILVEVSPSVHDAIRIATIHGVTVVEAAGNGAIDLANPPTPFDAKLAQKLDLTLPMRSDSGAVVVGAGFPKLPSGKWRRAPLSTHGARVDCFAQGEEVPAPKTTSPSANDHFGGTSAASSIIAGLVANLQGMASAAEGRPLAPQDVRDLLRNENLGTGGEPGIRSMPDLRKIARSQRWARVLPVAAVPVANDSALLVYLDEDDHVVRRHFSFFAGWGRPLAMLEKGDLWPAQPTVLSWSEPDRLVHQVLASGPDGVHRAWWDSNLAQQPFEPLATLSGATIAPGIALSAVRAGDDDLVIVGIDDEASLIALPARLLSPGLGGPVAIGGIAKFSRAGGFAAVSLAAGSVDAVAIADHGALLWCHGNKPFETGWQLPVVEPSFTAFIPGVRPAALAVGGKILIAAVGDQGWPYAIEIDPSQDAVPAAFAAPVVVDTGVTIATQGPLALERLKSPPFDMVLLFGVDTEGVVQVFSRPAAGGDWARVLAVPSDGKISALGGVVAITSPDLGVMAFAVGVDGLVRVARARSLFDWSGFALLPEGVPLPPNPPSPPVPPPTPGSLLISNAFRGDAVLEAVAADKDRISRTRNAASPAVGKIQHALLLWDAVSLPVHGEDGEYGDETARAVRDFKADALGVPPAQIVDDVGPATVLRLDKIQAESEGLLGTKTTFRFLNEYGDPLSGLDFTVTTPALIEMMTTGADGQAGVCLDGPAQVALDPGSALCAVGDLLDREWPPVGGFAEGVLMTPVAPIVVTVQPGDTLDVVVATRIELTASLVAPIEGAVRVEGRGAVLDVTADGVRLALQATGNQTATVRIDPLPTSGPLPELPPLIGWTPIGTYTVRSGDTEESLAKAFAGDPDDYAVLSNHPPVVGEQLALPEIPGWLGMALDPVSAPVPVEWFTVCADQIIAALLAGGESDPLQDLLAVLDRPPAAGPDVAMDLSARAQGLAAMLSGPPVGPGSEVEDGV